MQDFIAYTIAGLSVAGIYAITASGLTLTYMTTGIFNFAHGATGMVIAFCFWQLRVAWGVPPVVAWIVCILVLAPLVGVALERFVMRPLEGASEVSRLVVTISLLLFLVAFALTAWDPDTFRSVQPLFPGHTFDLGVTRLTYNDATVLLIAVLVALGLWVLLTRTRAGVAMRATVDDRSLVALNAADPNRSAAIAWIASTMLAGLAGVLMAPKLSLSPLPLTLLIVNAYAAAIIGRLRSLPLTFLGALVLGLLTSYAVGYVDSLGSQHLQGLVGTIPVLVLFAALLRLRPSALTGHDARRARSAAQLSWRGAIGLGVACVAGSAMLAAGLSAGDLFSSAKVWGLAIVGLSFIPLVGYAGRLSLCQLTFAGVGAVVMAHTAATLLGLVLAAAVAAVLGVLVALPALRLSGIYMALATAAIAVAFDRWVFVLPAFSVFGHELDLFDGGSLTVDRPGLVAGSTAFFLFGAVVFALVALVVVAIRRSRLGGRLLAMSDSERAAASLGIDLRRHTLAVFALSAAIAGVGGAVYGMAVQSTPPDPFSFFSGLPLLLFMVVIGVDSLAAAALAGLFLGAPLVPNLFPGFEQLTSLTVGALAIVVGRHPYGIADAVRARFAVVRRSPLVLAGAIAICVASWALCVAGAISQAAWLLITLAVVSPLTVAVARWAQGRSVEVGEDVRLGLSQPPELLGLTQPVARHDVAILDRALGLPRRVSVDG